VGDDAEGAAIDMLVVGEPAPAPGEEGGEKPDPQVLLNDIESALAQLRQIVPAAS
jgi:hypothetical protein